MILLELFQDKPVNWEWTKQSNVNWVAVFDVPVPLEKRRIPAQKTLTYYVSISDPDGNGIWNINFFIRGLDQMPIFDLTGTGNSFIVFNTIVNILFEFDKIKKPTGFEFEGFDTKQFKLYGILVDRLLKKTDFKKRISSNGIGYILTREHPNVRK